MKVIISPAKKMKLQEGFTDCTEPLFIERARDIVGVLSQLSLAELQELYGCNSAIATLNFERLKTTNLSRLDSHAILAYDGIQYKYMCPSIFENGSFDYVQEHLVILSALYGGLRPLDGVCAYRLEMQAGLKINGCKNLYEYWGGDIYDAFFQNEDVIVNLASKEYSKAIQRYVAKCQRWVDVSFAQVVDKKLVEKGVYVKMARGEMVAFMAQNNIHSVDEIKKFDRLGYSFNHDFSTDTKLVFIKE